MCTFPAIANTVLQIGGNYLGQKAQASAAKAQMQAQADAAITNMNFAFQNYELERTDAFDAAVNEIIKVRQNAMQLNSNVEASIAEEMGGGRTAMLLQRSVHGDTARAVASIQDNFDRKDNEIDLNKEATWKQTKLSIDNINKSAPQMPSRFTNFLTTAGTVMSAYTSAQDTISDNTTKGFKTNFWTGGAKI